MGVGKVDLLGLLSTGECCVLELKAASGSDTPLKAMLEALGYAAIVEANLDLHPSGGTPYLVLRSRKPVPLLPLRDRPSIGVPSEKTPLRPLGARYRKTGEAR